jgi:Tfp pilus assembly PilM family ATPase
MGSAVVTSARARLRPGTLPLGIDLGASRLRVALAHRANGRAELVAVATRTFSSDPATALTDAVAELKTRERRCVFGLGEPRALLRSIRFPAMRRGEQERAARFEATQFVDYPIREAVVRVIPLGSDGDAVIGVVHQDVIASLVSLAHSAKLRVAAVDNNAFALRRALPDVDAVLDIGLDDSRLHVFTGRFPIGRRFLIGGAAFTQAVAHALGCDTATAERRKLTHGIAGCGDGAREALIADVANALAECRSAGLGDVRTMALAGNGGRLNDLPAAIERATGVRVLPAALASETSQTLPLDVLRAAAQDWCLAYGLARWALP